jgi:hypothetical protein
MVLLAVSFAFAEWRRETAVQAARAATTLEIERMLSEGIRRADGLARAADRILSPLPVMTPAEEEALRRFRNAAHVARARTIGARAVDRAATDSLLAAGRLVELDDSARHWIVRRGTSPAYVVPQLEALLGLVGERFQARLIEMGLPLYRLEVTSALRTTERQQELRRTNSNAAAGVSSHEFGTTVDLSYAAFAPPAERPDDVLVQAPPEFAPHLARILDLALESVSARKSRELGAILSRVLAEAQSEGLALVIYERQQTVYHLTVARADLQRSGP